MLVQNDAGVRALRYDSLQRFFAEVDDGVESSHVLPPGERGLFVGRPQVDCVPQRLDLVVTQPSTPGGAYDRHVKGRSVRVHEIRYGSRVATCDKDTFGPRVDLSASGVRSVHVWEPLAAVVENTTAAPVHVRASFVMRGDQDHTYILGADPRAPRTTRRLRVPPSNAGCVDVLWEPKRACLIKRIWLHPERKDMSDLVIFDIKVRNRSQLSNSTAVPMEMFSDGLPVKMEAVNFGTVAFVVENLTNEERYFEVEVEAEVDDEPLWMGEALVPANASSDTPRDMRDMREYPLGFYADKIAPGATVHSIVSRPAIPFRGERLIVPSSIGHHFQIAGIRVGDRERLEIGRPYEATLHSESNQHNRVPLNLPTAQADSDIVLRVINTSSEPQRFIAALIGTAVGTESVTRDPMPPEIIADAMEVMKETPQFQAIVRQIARQKRNATA